MEDKTSASSEASIPQPHRMEGQNQEPVAAAVVPVPVPVPVPAVSARDHEIDEVMQFLRFSVKQSTSFEGTILFKFKDDDGLEASSYAVEIDSSKYVTTIKNAAAEDVSATCEVGISVDDFLWIYSGKASSSDIVKLFYSGRLSISGYAFRKASTFAQSFDFSSDKWTKFYAWRDKQQDKLEQTRSAELTGAHTLTRDHWLLHCRTILKRYNIPRLQRMQWEASLASMFGEKYVLDKVYSDTAGHNHRALTCSDLQPQQPKQTEKFFSVIGSVVAPTVAATWKTMHPPGLGQQHETALQRQLAQFLHPCPKHTTKYANSVCVDAHKDIFDMFAFFDENYVHEVKSSAKHRVRQQQLRNRVDLGDAGMQQLDKLVQMIGKGGHSNHKQMNTSKYVPAPEVLLREFRLNATVVVDAVKEKVLGRQSLDKIPAPSMDWWIYGSRTNLLVVDESKQTHLEPAVKSVIAANTQAGMVEVERRPTYHRRGSRKRDQAKKHLQAKLESFSRDLVKPPSLRTVNVEDHLVMSDYL